MSTLAELSLRLARLERIVAALKALLHGRTHVEIAAAEAELKRLLAAKEKC